jgi:RND family efflux transporter MFP subunit
MKRLAPLLSLAVVLAACGAPPPPEAPDGGARRKVVAAIVQPKPLEVKVRFPVVTRPFEEVELRAAGTGKLVYLANELGDVIEAQKLPAAVWHDPAPEGTEPEPGTDPLLRNIGHLNGLKSFARIDDNQLIQTLRENQASYDQALRDLERLKGYKETTRSQLDNAQTRLASALATTQRTVAMIEDTYVTSPVRGDLMLKPRREGEYVTAGELLGKVVVLDRILADFELPEAQYSAVKEGDELLIVFGAMSDGKGGDLTRNGKVRRKDRVAHGQTHSFTVELLIDNTDGLVPAGIFGTVNVVSYSNAEAMVVPLSAVKLNGDQKSLFIVDEGAGKATEIADVVVGQMSLDYAEILDKRLKPGTRVVTFGAQWLSDGSEIEWTEEDPSVRN